MKTNFSDDVILTIDDVTFDFIAHQVFDEEALEESIDKLLALRKRGKGEKIIQMNFAQEVTLPIKEQTITRCFFTTDKGEVVTEDLELDIMSVEAASKEADNNSNFAQFLGFMKTKKEKDKSFVMSDYISAFMKSKEFQKWKKENIKKEED